MSEFVAQIRAELDTSDAEQKLKNLTNSKHKIKLEPEINTDEVDKKLKSLTKDNKKIKLDADVDTKKAEQKLKSLKDNQKIELDTEINIDSKSTQKGLNETIEQTRKQTKKNPIEIDYKVSKNSASQISQLKDSANSFFSLFTGNRNVVDFGADKIRSAVSDLKDLNTTLVEIDKSGNLTNKQLSDLGKNSYDAASKWGSLVKDYMSSSETFAQAGFSNLEEMSDLATMAQMAGQMTADTSSKFLIASDAAWQMQGNVEKLTSVLDGCNQITNKNALNMSDLANGIRVAGSMMANSGLSEDQAAALIGTGVATTKDSGDTVARGLRTIIMNLRQIKGETEDGELIDQEQLEKVEATCNSVGVSLKTVKDGVVELRNPIDILRELSEVYNTLDTMDARRARITDDIAGKNRGNVLASILTNFDQYDKMLQDYSEGSGSAMREAMKTADSWEGRLNSLSNSWTEFVSGFVNTDLVKGGISGIEGMISAFDKLNDAQLFIPTMISSIMGLQNLFTGKGITDIGFDKEGKGSLGKLNLEGNLFGIDFTKMGNWKRHFAEAETYLGKWNALCLKGRTSLEDFESEFVKQNTDFKDYISTVKDGTASLDGYKKHLSATGAEFEKFNMKSVMTNALTGFLVGAGIELALAGITTFIDQVVHKQDRLAESATEVTSAWEETNGALSDQIEKYKELKQQLDSGSLSPTQEYEIRQQILDIQSQITSQYGDQVSGIDLVNGSLQTQLGLLQQISSETAKKTLNESREEYKNAQEQMTKERDYNLGFVEKSDKKAINKEIKEIAKSFEDAGISLSESGGISTLLNIRFKGDTTQAEEVINDFMNRVDELKSKYADDKGSIKILDSILDDSGESYSANKTDVLEKYQDNYKSFLQMDMLSQGTGKGSISDAFNRYTESVQKYNEALASGDTDKIIQARSEFASLGSEVDNLLSKEGNNKFSVLFDDVADQLSEASVKVFDFQEALAGKKSDNSQFKKISDDIQEAGNNLKRLKLDAEDVREALITSGKQKGETAIQTLAKAWGIDAESSTEEIYAFTDALAQAGIISGQVSEEIENATSSFDTYSTSVEKAKENLDKLKTIMSESVSGAGISADNVEEFRQMFGADAEKALERTTNGYHLNKKALAELQVQLDAMTKSDYLSALSDQYTELQNIEGKIAAAELLGADTSGLEASKNSILDNITHLQDLQFQYEATTSAYQQWQLAMSGGEEGDMYDSIVGSMKSVEEDLYNKGLTGTNAFREFTDLISNKDLSTASNEDIVSAYEEALPIVKRYFTEGQEGAQNFLIDIQNINEEWAHMNEDGSWDINFGIGQDQAIADALNMDVEAVQMVMRKLSDFGFDINLDEPIASLEELRAKAESANDTLNGLGEDIKIDLNVDSFEGVDKQIASMKKYIGEVENSDIELDVKSDKLESANSILEYLVAKKKEIADSEGIDIIVNIDESQIQAAFETLDKLKSNLENIQGKVGIDTTDLQTEIDNCVAEIEKMSPEMKVALGIQGMSIEEIKAGLLDGTIEIPVNAETSEANNNIDEVKKNDIKDKKFDVKANTTQAKSELAAVKSFLSGITGKTVTVTVNKVTNEITNKSSSAGSLIGNTVSSGIDKLKNQKGAVNGTAHVKGTAYARGNWGTPVSQKALVGELGTEMIVDPHTGIYYTVGEHGAEIVEIPKNAIIFNHLQTESLLKNGYAVGRGTALVSGTAFSNGSGTFNVGNSGSNAYSSSNNSSSNTNTSSTSSDLDSAEEFKETLDAIEILINRIERDIKNIERVAGSAYNTFTKRNNALKNQVAAITEEISIQQQGYNRYLQEAESVSLSEDYKSLVRSGAIDISTITDKDLSENINLYKQWYEKALDCRDAIEELTESVRDLYKEAFDNVVTLYDGMLSQIEHRRNMLEGYVDQTEAQGYIVSTKYYDALITNEQNKLSKLNKERDDLINALNDAIVNGDIEVESEAWYDMQASINEVNESIQESTTSIIEFKNAIREIEWGIFDKIQDRISSITDEADFLVELMSDEKMYDDNGKVTKHGTATYGLHGVNYNVYMSQADQYRKEMESIQKELSKDPYNETLIERRKELLELQQESILAAEEEKDAIRNLVEEGIEKQLEALDKLIDKYLEAIDSQKDMYDYQKKIGKQQKEIDSLRKQIIAYAGDDSEEGSVRKQQTENKLKEAEENLEESLYDKAISDQKKLLDELYSEYETVLNMRLDNIDVLISEVIANINSDASEIRDTLVSEADKVGYKLTDSMNTIWGANGTIATILTTYSNNFSSTMTTVKSAINNIYVAIQNAITASNKSATSNISSIDKQQSQQTTVKNPTTSKPDYSSILNSKPTTSTNSGGDGVPRIGDKVTYVSGSYFYSSDGLNPSGNQMLGQQVYITNINNASWAQKPYHISRTSVLGQQDLGWVNLDQLKGYKTGAKFIDRNMLAWTQEEGGELILGRYDGAMLMPNKDGVPTSLRRGDAVIDADGTDNLLSFSKNPGGFLQQKISKLKMESMAERGEVVGGGQTMNNEYNLNMVLNHVVDVDDFIDMASHSNRYQRFFESMLGTAMTGKNRMGKYMV